MLQASVSPGRRSNGKDTSAQPNCQQMHHASPSNCRHRKTRQNRHHSAPPRQRSTEEGGTGMDWGRLSARRGIFYYKIKRIPIESKSNACNRLTAESIKCEDIPHGEGPRRLRNFVHRNSVFNYAAAFPARKAQGNFTHKAHSDRIFLSAFSVRPFARSGFVA